MLEKRSEARVLIPPTAKLLKVNQKLLAEKQNNTFNSTQESYESISSRIDNEYHGINILFIVFKPTTLSQSRNHWAHTVPFLFALAETDNSMNSFIVL